MWLHYSEETSATFYSQWGHIGGCWSTWASSASPSLKGGSLRGLKKSEIEQKRLMSHKLCLPQIIPFLPRCCSSQQRCTGIDGPTAAVMPVPTDMSWSLAAHPSTSAELLAKRAKRFSISTCELRSMITTSYSGGLSYGRASQRLKKDNWQMRKWRIKKEKNEEP